MTGGHLFGIVVDFDEHVGLGVVRGIDGTELAFHCVSIIDGTRTIEVGTPVRYRIAARLGADEAVGLERR